MKRKISLIISILIIAVLIIIAMKKSSRIEYMFKDIESIYYSESMNYHYSLTPDERANIYLSTINDLDSCLVFDQLSHTAGLVIKEKSNIVFIDPIVRTIIEDYWQKNNIANRFISNPREYIQNKFVVDGFELVIWGPIKKINGVILVGFMKYRGPMNAVGGLMKIEKYEGMWKSEYYTIPWTS